MIFRKRKVSAGDRMIIAIPTFTGSGIHGLVLAAAFSLLGLMKGLAETEPAAVSPAASTNAAAVALADLKELPSSLFQKEGTIDLPSGVFQVKPGQVIPENVTKILGHDTRLVLAPGKTAMFLAINRTQPLVLSDIEFEGSGQNRVLEVSASKNISIQDCRVSGMSLIRTGRDEKLNQNISVTHVVCDGPGTGDCIELRFVQNATVSGNVVKNYRHGIMWWGGDAAKITVTDDPDYLTRKITIKKNKIGQVTGGGIWGSMGEDLVISENTVDGAGDVGIDVEGCKNAVISKNVVYDAKNGALTVFFFSRNILFSENVITSREAKFPVFRSYNKSQNALAHPSVAIRDNFFTCEKGVASFDDNHGPMKAPAVSGNVFKNVRLALSFNNASSPVVENNQMTFTEPCGAGLAAAEIRGFKGQAWIQNNKIISTVKPMAGIGVSLRDDDYNNRNVYYLRNNVIQGFEKDVTLWAGNKNIGMYPTFFIEENILSHNLVEQIEASRRRWVISGNKNLLGEPLPDNSGESTGKSSP